MMLKISDILFWLLVMVSAIASLIAQDWLWWVTPLPLGAAIGTSLLQIIYRIDQ